MVQVSVLPVFAVTAAVLESALITVKAWRGIRSSLRLMDAQPQAEHHTSHSVLGDATPAGVFALHDLAQTNLANALALLACRPASIHQDVHQARKHLRRVRAALALGALELGSAAQSLDAELGRLCRGLSHLRDAQAMIEALTRLRDRPTDTAVTITDAIAIALARRDAVLAAVLARDPGFAARRRRLQRAQTILERLPWGRVDRDTVLTTLARADRRVAKAEKQAKKHPKHDEDWHRLRRRVRRSRQMQALAHSAFGVEVALHDGSEARATALGESQDDTLILKHCHSHSPFPPPLRRELRAIATDRVHRARH